jgi:hypothetical protein
MPRFDNAMTRDFGNPSEANVAFAGGSINSAASSAVSSSDDGDAFGRADLVAPRFGRRRDDALRGARGDDERGAGMKKERSISVAEAASLAPRGRQ